MAIEHPTLILCPVGGLANRMRSLASGFALANDMGVHARVIWSVTGELRAPYEALFRTERIPCLMHNAGPAASLWLWDSPRKRNLGLSPLLSGHFNRLDDRDLWPWLDDAATVRRKAEEKLVNSRALVIRSGQDFYRLPVGLYRHIFEPCDEVKDLCEPAVDVSCTGLHIRRTDNALSIAASPVEAYEAYIRNHPGERFFLATDDAAVKARLLRDYPHCIITHQGPLRRDSVEGCRHALAEMWMLSRCRAIVGSAHSSFTHAAALLGGKPFVEVHSEQ